MIINPRKLIAAACWNRASTKRLEIDIDAKTREKSGVKRRLEKKLIEVAAIRPNNSTILPVNCKDRERGISFRPGVKHDHARCVRDDRGNSITSISRFRRIRSKAGSSGCRGGRRGRFAHPFPNNPPPPRRISRICSLNAAHIYSLTTSEAWEGDKRSRGSFPGIPSQDSSDVRLVVLTKRSAELPVERFARKPWERKVERRRK